jgi:hypothetical protein
MSQTIEVTEQELVELIRRFERLDLVFGPGWVGLKWEEGEPIPEAVKYLGLMRGVLNENMDGAGI